MVAQEALKVARETRRAIRMAAKNHDAHLIECTSARMEVKKAMDALIAKTDAQTVVLTDVNDILPAMKEWYVGKKSRERMWSAVGNFFYNAMRKNLDSLSGKLLLFAVLALMVWKGASWADAIKVLFP